MKIGKQIKIRREERQWTLKDLSHKTGISVSYLSDIERGVSTPSLKKLKSIANAFNIKASLLLEESKDKPTTLHCKIPIINQKYISLPLLSSSNIIDYHCPCRSLSADDNLLIVKIEDNSMKNNGIFYSSKVLIKKTGTIKQGELACLLFHRHQIKSILIRRLYKTEDEYILVTGNPKFKPEIIPQKKIKIIGKVIRVIHDLD